MQGKGGGKERWLVSGSYEADLLTKLLVIGKAGAELNNEEGWSKREALRVNK